MFSSKAHRDRGLLLSVALLAAACGGDEKKAGDGGAPDDEQMDPAQTSDGGIASGMDGGSSQNDPNAPAPVGALPTYKPTFPGAGQSGDDAPLTNGKLCDYVPANGAPSPNDITKCFFGNGNTVPSATLEQVLECTEGKDVVHVRLTFNPNFVDNTYGAGAIGWPHKRGHTWADLYKSDHAEILMNDATGSTVLRFKIDYVTADASAPSGYGTLGVKGGDGSVLVGNAAWVLDTSTSIHKNLNERGYGSYLVDSPLTDTKYTPNPAAPNWDYRVVYEAWVDVKAFGTSGFGGATIESVHASPAKGGSDTIIVEPGPCPPENCSNPDGCQPSNGAPDAGCVEQPDHSCNESPSPQPTPDAGCSEQPDHPCHSSPSDASVQPDPQGPDAMTPE